MLYYLFVFLGAVLFDVVPILGPPAWTLMVFFQIKYHLNIWAVLVCGVIGSTVGRYMFSFIIAKFAERFLKAKKNQEMQLLGARLEEDGWKFELFVLLYTLLPISSTPLFSATGIAHVKPFRVLGPFFIGKFISDMMMVMVGDYAAANMEDVLHNLISWQSISGIVISLLFLFLIFFIDWKYFLLNKKIRFNFKIWK